MDYQQEILSGNRRALAKAITFVENGHEEGRALVSRLFKHCGHAQVIGITGPPGSGKSTLTGKLTQALRKRGQTVGVILIDPSSPFTGGAILGDRIRMPDIVTDPGVFIRSMGTRGSLGGLSSATADVIKLMDVYGFDVILIETVGIGQAETDIVENADTTVVVSVPGLGDDIQTIKAGVMEIGDLFVVNKADRDGAERVVNEINMMLDLAPRTGWRPPVVKTVALKTEGIDRLLEELDRHEGHLRSSGQLAARRQARYRRELLDQVEIQLRARLFSLFDAAEINGFVQSISQGEIDPYRCAQQIVMRLTQHNQS
ncbi:MAG: methylmalonyl Co-A mutase-associated GTPase MeaB [Bacillota bacterium]